MARIDKWLQRVQRAVSAADGVPMIFSTSLVGREYVLEQARRGMECEIVRAMVDPDVERAFDEEALPMVMVRFKDGKELVAGTEELFSHDPRFLELLSAVSAGFAVARSLGYAGPFDIRDTGTPAALEQFEREAAAFIVGGCEQHFNTPPAFRLQAIPAEEAGVRGVQPLVLQA